MFLRPRYGVVGMIGLPYMLVFEFLGPVFVFAPKLKAARLKGLRDRKSVV